MMEQPKDITVADLRFFLQHLPGEMRVMIQCDGTLYAVNECWPDPDNNTYNLTLTLSAWEGRS